VTYFKYNASEYDRGRRDEHRSYWVNETSATAGLSSSSSILDLGCGTGNYSIEFKTKTSGEVYGLDLSPDMLKVASHKPLANRIGWLHGSAEAIPCREESFDCIFASQVWHHIEHKSIAVGECHRVLRSAAPLVILTMSHEQWRAKPVCCFFPEILPSQLAVYPPISEIIESLEEAGFHRVDAKPYQLETYTLPEEFIEIAEKKLWSMFKYVSEENTRKGVAQLKRLKGKPIRNDELITLVIGWK
jgi:ubiquinone/menaquinone biosynthesis C-methylase UbiE